MANERIYIEKRLAEYLSQRLLERQISKAAFADEMGVAPAVLSRILGASAGLDADSKVFQRIAEKLGYAHAQTFAEVLLNGNETFSPDYLTLALPHCLEVAPLFTLQKQGLLPEHTQIQPVEAYDFVTPPASDVYVWPRKSYMETWTEVSQISEAQNVVMYVFGENHEALPKNTNQFWNWLNRNPQTSFACWRNEVVKEQVEVFLNQQMQYSEYQDIAALLATKMSVFSGAEAPTQSGELLVLVGFDTVLSSYRQVFLSEKPYVRINLSKSIGAMGQWAFSLWASPRILDNPLKVSKLIELTEKIHEVRYEPHRLIQAEKAHLAEMFFPQTPQALTVLDAALQDIRFDFVNQLTIGFVKGF